MYRQMFVLGVVALAACRGGGSPEMRVIGVHDVAPHEVVFVQVTNPASHSMRLTKLQYTFAADTGKEVSAGEVELARDVPAHAAVIVEIPLDAAAPDAGPITLHGELTTELDEIVRSFTVSAQVQPQPSHP